MNQAIKASGDRKVKFWDNQKNTFGLLPGPEGTCPMATVGPGGCRCVEAGRKNPTCYVYNTMSAYKAVRGVLDENTQLLKSAGSAAKQVEILSVEFKRFRDTELRRDKPQLFYRLHWSGDIYDNDYALALSQAMKQFPDITFWCYTRSLPFAQFLADNTPNLILYLSLDPVNIQFGLGCYYEWLAGPHPHNNLQICYMSKQKDFNEQYLRAYYRRQLAGTLASYTSTEHVEYPAWPKDPPELQSCPVDEGKMKLDGGCANCRRCLTKASKTGQTRPVWFNA